MLKARNSMAEILEKHEHDIMVGTQKRKEHIFVPDTATSAAAHSKNQLVFEKKRRSNNLKTLNNGGVGK